MRNSYGAAALPMNAQAANRKKKISHFFLYFLLIAVSIMML